MAGKLTGPLPARLLRNSNHTDNPVSAGLFDTKFGASSECERFVFLASAAPLLLK